MEHDEQQLTRAEALAILGYAEATYRSVTTSRRRIATAFLVVAVLFGVLFVAAAVQWASTSSRIPAVEDAPLVEALGVEIPDPRPAIERGQLRLQSLLWQLVTIAAAAIALIFLALWALTRPPPAPALPRM